jgi:hypothetical protein
MPEQLLKEHSVDFAGKVLWVVPTRIAAPDNAAGFILEFPSLQNRMGKIFLAGRRPHTRKGQWVGHDHVSVAWSAIVRFVVFESREDYMRRRIELVNLSRK